MKKVVALVVAIFFTLALAPMAYAQSACGTVSFTLTPNQGPAGSSVSYSGSGARSSDLLGLFFDTVSGTTLLGITTSDGSGNFNDVLTIPADAVVGSHNIIVEGTDSEDIDIACPETFTVTESVQQNAYAPASLPATLPSTGFMLLLPAAGLVLGGLGAATFRKNRRKA
ncbi:MAG: hypothetical protein HZB44_05415 [Actinobacteria bacterium]|nr:hypothetical protein [Actinomycetota bacterium]